MSSNYSHVRGDTFSVLHLRQQKDGTGRDLTGYQIHAELQHRAGQLVELLTVTMLDQTSHAGEFVLSVPDTAAWPLARLRYKIRFTDPQGVITTSGFIDLRITESYPADCCADEPTVQVSVSPEISIVEADPDQLFVQVGTVISIAGSGGGISLPIAQSAVSGLIPRLDAADAELATTKTLAQVNQLNIGLKADHTELETTNAQVELNRLAILTKADLTALSALALLVSSKADASAVAQQIADLVGTDTQVLAAIQTLGAALAEDQDLLDALEYTVANRVRFDTATQALTSLQKANARTNISAEELGTAALLIAQITAASLGAATAAQGAKADTALQSTDVAPVALSGNYNDLSNLPTVPKTLIASTEPLQILSGTTAPDAIPHFFTFTPESDGTYILTIDFLMGAKSGSQGVMPQFFINSVLVTGGTGYVSTSLSNAQQCQAEFKVVKSGTSYRVYAWCRSHPVGNTLTLADAALTQITTQGGTPVLGFNVRPSGLVTINSLVVQNVTLTKL